MCNLFVMYYTFFILHSAKAYLGPFQTSTMDFFSGKIYRRSDCSYIDMTASKHYFIIQKGGVTYGRIIQIKVKVLSSLYCPTFCLTSVPRAFCLFRRNYLKWKFVQFEKNWNKILVRKKSLYDNCCLINREHFQ